MFIADIAISITFISENVCTEGQYACKNLYCIPNKWVCDGQNDCDDFSDEINCVENDLNEMVADQPANERIMINGNIFKIQFKILMNHWYNKFMIIRVGISCISIHSSQMIRMRVHLIMMDAVKF